MLPAAQQRLWAELGSVPPAFALYGGTALALRLGHRQSVDFDFFATEPFDAGRLADSIPWLRDAERVQVGPNTLSCRVERDGPVLVSFLGGLRLGQIVPHDRIEVPRLEVASLPDLAATKAAVVQKRAELRDYLDIDALLSAGLDLATILAAGRAVYGVGFNPLITVKALTYFADVPELPAAVRHRLLAAVRATDMDRLPELPVLRAPAAGGAGP
ncbi:MAG: hypothetical protein EPO25_13385 [Gammaproteobacteria bacterium]|nr:MAG: hypothetical protein EPO25_13385 [Gammaproteobacteria bacterium]